MATEAVAADAGSTTWDAAIVDALKLNKVRLISYVPDRVLSPLLKRVMDDPYFTVIGAAREEEALGIVSGAWMGGMLGAVLMQTSGFATLANQLASLVVPYQLPVIMIISERGTLGEFNVGQVMVCRTVRPVLDSLAIEHHTIRRLDEANFVTDRAVLQAVGTQQPVALILNPQLTGGKIERKA